MNKHQQDDPWQELFEEKDKDRKIRMAAVVIILAVLLSLCSLCLITNFTDRVRPSPFTKAYADMRQLREGLENYFSDHGTYPPTLSALTTPVVYISDFPADPFMENGNISYRYHVEEEEWILWSTGIDRDYDIQVSEINLATDEKVIPINAIYDPTNGTKSNGDIWHQKY